MNFFMDINKTQNKFDEIKETSNKIIQIFDQHFAHILVTSIVNLNHQLDALYHSSMDYGILKLNGIVEETQDKMK
jgi:hypothetical protein